MVLALVLAGWWPSLAAAHARIFVPRSIDGSGRTDVTVRLQDFVDRVPDGATIEFRPHARYRIDGTLQWRHRSGITLEGNEATLVAGIHGGPNRAQVRLLDVRHWIIRDLNVIGSDHTAGRFEALYQWQHGFDLRGVDGVVLQRVSIRDVFGDDIYVGLSTTSAHWSRDVKILDSIGIGSGRMSIAVTAGRRVTVRGGLWANPGLDTFDIEPNGYAGGADHIIIEHTRIGIGSHASVLTVAGQGPVANIVLRENRLLGRPLTVDVDQGSERPRNIAIQGNTSRVVFAGPGPAAMIFHNTDGVTVTGDTQPLRTSEHLALVAIEGATRVKVSGSYLQLRPVDAWLRYGLVPMLAAIGGLLLLLRLRARTTRGRRYL